MDSELPPPFVTVPSLTNLRDIGGWPIVDSNGTVLSTVRKHILYRGPDPSPVSDAGLAKLHDLSITTSFDLRSKPQIDKAGGYKELAGIQRVWCPVFSETDYSPQRAAARYLQYSSDGTEGIVEAFTEILVHGAPVFRTILLHLVALPSATPPTSSSAAVDGATDLACLIHCTTGNNRTGVFMGVLLSFLGVRDKDIAAEYALSNAGLAPIRKSVVARLVKSPVFAEAGEAGWARAERMVGAREESMLAMLEMVRQRWGSAERYVRDACGLTEDEVERLRRVLGGGDVKECLEQAAP